MVSHHWSPRTLMTLLTPSLLFNSLPTIPHLRKICLTCHGKKAIHHERIVLLPSTTLPPCYHATRRTTAHLHTLNLCLLRLSKHPLTLVFYPLNQQRCHCWFDHHSLFFFLWPIEYAYSSSPESSLVHISDVHLTIGLCCLNWSLCTGTELDTTTFVAL